MTFEDYINNPLADLGTHNIREVGRDNVCGFTIDTCWTNDEGFETAIEDSKGDWHVVERYKTQEESAEGHEKWIEKIRNGERKVKCLSWSDTSNLDGEIKLK